jgi:hypothetical protein
LLEVAILATALFCAWSYGDIRFFGRFAAVAALGFVARRGFRSEPREPGSHTFFTLLLVSVGGFVTVCGLLFASLIAMMVREGAGRGEPLSPLFFAPPIGVLGTGIALLALGTRLKKRVSGSPP